MQRIETAQIVEARLAWALVWIGAILFLGALMWGMLNPHFYTFNDVTNDTSAESPAADTGWERVRIVWSLWPFWFGLGLLYYGFRRAINESKRVP